ncbi:glycoside hydrolase domain-containing protein [Dactylosporangium salmoneum]|uniref:glycoside hydrolase domain-containing protein n=1 Tax=Dactylosporangium salmoneum TaxID=53361 RepID=UPI0031D6CD3D
MDTAGRTISGYADHKGGKLYFSATVDTAIAASGGGGTGWVRFATGANQQVTLRISTSWMSVAQAAANLSQEVGGKSLDTVRDEAQAQAQWDTVLGKVRIEGATADQMVTFNGEMSAWYVFSAMGFHPARMGSTDYTIGAPLFSKATISLENGHTLVVNAPGVSDTNRYIQSAALNGTAYTKNYLAHADLLAGGTLSFTMGASPSSWGTGANDVPPSITSGTAAPARLTDKATGGTLTASGENGPGEARDKLTDDTSMTKWLTFAATATLTDQLASAVTIKQYTLTSADDVPGRDPKNWTLQASNDGVTWTTIDTRTNVDFADRRQTRAFVVPGTASYSRYRLQITANHGAAETQLAEWQLLG